MKPLELAIHRLFQDRQGEDWYVWQGTAVRPYIADMYSDRKRLNGVELAAEYHAQAHVHTGMNYDDVYLRYVEEEDPCTTRDERFAEYERTKTIHRFATRPHYDEVTA